VRWNAAACAKSVPQRTAPRCQPARRPTESRLVCPFANREGGRVSDFAESGVAAPGGDMLPTNFRGAELPPEPQLTRARRPPSHCEPPRGQPSPFSVGKRTFALAFCPGARAYSLGMRRADALDHPSRLPRDPVLPRHGAAVPPPHAACAAPRSSRLPALPTSPYAARVTLRCPRHPTLPASPRPRRHSSPRGRLPAAAPLGAPGRALLPRAENAPPLAPAGGRGYGTAFRGRFPPHSGGRPPALRAWR
jgi:hypothetical protein